MFTYNLVFKSVFYKGASKISLLCVLVIGLHQVDMRGYLTLHVVNTVVTIMIEAVIYGISRGDNMGVMTRLLNPLQFVPLDQGAWEISTGV